MIGHRAYGDDEPHAYAGMGAMGRAEPPASEYESAKLLLGAEIRRRRTAAGWSQENLSARTGVDQGHISKAETGKVPPSAAAVEKIDRALKANGALVELCERAASLRQTGEAGQRAPIARTAPDLATRPWTDGEVAWSPEAADSAPSWQEEEATRRRELLEALAASAGLALAGLPVLSPAQRLSALEATASADTALSLAEADFSGIMADYLTISDRERLARIVALQRFMDGISQFSLRPAELERLWRLAAMSAGVRAWNHRNLGDADAARMSLAEAHRRGQLLDDDKLIAWSRHMQSTIEESSGNITSAERYAVDGLRHASSGPQRAVILVENIAAVCAVRGDLAGVDKAVEEAVGITSAHGPAQQSPLILDLLHSYDALSCATFGGAAYARLGRPDRLALVTSDARAAADRSEHQHRSIFRFDEALATARSKDPDPEQIAHLTEEGIALASDDARLSVALVGDKLNKIASSTDSRRQTPAIRELHEQAREWTRTRLPVAGA
jgi:transcriptional regulator with XRE-family HTH domain